MALTDQEHRPAAFRWAQPTSLYVHVPFCRHRCGYCNFSVIAGRDSLIDQYLDAIDQELQHWQTRSDQHVALRTVYLGGGTPTHLSIAQLQRLLSSIRNRFSIHADAEISIEANPEDIDTEKVRFLAAEGVNRISLGIQSFRLAKLQRLERSHQRETAMEAVTTCQRYLGNVSLDLIFGAPDETLDHWLADVETAFSLPIAHLSTYALTFEKGTSFWNGWLHGQLEPVSEDTDLAMYQAVRRIASERDWEHYEVSNFSQRGSACQHNLAYWQGKAWHAVGPGAARFIDGRREVNHRSTTTYLKRIAAGQSPTVESEPLSLIQYACERAAFGVRMLAGVRLDEIQAETGVDVTALRGANLELCQQQGWLTLEQGQARLTDAGLLMADVVASAFLVEQLSTLRFSQAKQTGNG